MSLENDVKTEESKGIFPSPKDWAVLFSCAPEGIALLAKVYVYVHTIAMNEAFQQIAHGYYHLRKRGHERVKGSFEKNNFPYYRRV